MVTIDHQREIFLQGNFFLGGLFSRGDFYWGDFFRGEWGISSGGIFTPCPVAHSIYNITTYFLMLHNIITQKKSVFLLLNVAITILKHFRDVCIAEL
jgi:hypothetical protein